MAAEELTLLAPRALARITAGLRRRTGMIQAEKGL